MGVMARSGDINRIGAFVFSDCLLRTLMHETLDIEAVKALRDVREACALPAGHREAMLPTRCARLLPANSGLDAQGRFDYGWYFQTHGQSSLAAMARRDQAGVNSASDDLQAVCRRVVMFTPCARDIGLEVRILEDGILAADDSAGGF